VHYSHEVKVANVKTSLDPTEGEPARHTALIRTTEPLGMRASEVRYRRLFEAARDGILLVDPHTRKITDANPFMTELLGYPHEELVGKELWEIGLLEDEVSSRRAFCELQAHHFIRYENLPLQNVAGQRHEVEFVSNLYEEDGQQVIQCNIRDITERKLAERELLAARDVINRHASELETLVTARTAELLDTVSELEGFSYSVSHDMRAPLRAMQGYAQLLAEEYAGKPLDASGADYLQRISRAALRLDHLIQDVLSYTKVLRADAPMTRVDLDRLTRDIIETQPCAERPGSQILIEGCLPQVLGNEALLSQCISNLLSNALKLVAPGTNRRIPLLV
jgi:two-component system, LuxR family, sensor kinase FixL